MASLGLIESYVGKPDASGVFVLLEEDRLPTMKPMILLYGSYLAGILAFWFLRPFRMPRAGGADRQRFWIAMACTLLFNGSIVYLVARAHLRPGAIVADDVDGAAKLALWLSFVVAPINFHYFGMKMQGSQRDGE